MSVRGASASLRGALAGLDLAQLAADLVRVPSHPGLPEQERGVVDVLAAWLSSRGVPVEREDVRPGRPNLYAAVSAPRPGRRLVLCGHTDTVPVNQGDPGFGLSGEIHHGRLHGRGSVDMKGALAAMAGALVALSRATALPAGEVLLAAVVDEEMESLGAEALVGRGVQADGAVIGEPTENRLALGHKGLEWIEIRFQGRASHGGRPEEGTNAIVAAAKFIERAGQRLEPEYARRAHPRLGPPTLNIGTIHGGDQPSTVAAACTLTLDRRSVPGESWASITGELREVLSSVEAEMPHLSTELRRMPGGMATLEHVALDTPDDHPLAAAVREAVLAVRGTPAEERPFPAWTDGALLAEFGGIPCVVFGPGDLALAHSPRESIPVAAIDEAARVYAETAIRFTDPDAGRAQ